MNTSFLAFNPRLRQILETGTSENKHGSPISVNSTSTLNNLHVLRQVILRRKAKETLEVGMAFGASALAMLATMREVHGPTGFHHTAIDPFQSGHWEGAGAHVVGLEGLSQHFTLIEQRSFVALPSLFERGSRFDLIYVDGSHLFEDAFVDFYVSSYLLRTGGCILFDDCRDSHVAKVMRFILSNFSPVLRPMDLSPFELPDKPLFKRIGNQLGVLQLRGFEKISDPPRQWNSNFTRF